MLQQKPLQAPITPIFSSSVPGLKYGHYLQNAAQQFSLMNIILAGLASGKMDGL
ncbi:hypothetical protein [Pseudocnuella soli]|uniref:hypothetical protein n=1 Tax=Pseudocnuella soli TaxID=2502779 RepID=UPI001404733F|nr:hypothetical protein [Pseudocnuella soli]